MFPSFSAAQQRRGKRAFRYIEPLRSRCAKIFFTRLPFKPDTRGVLSVHYDNRIYPIPVDDNLGKKVPVGDSGLAVEVVEYYADAVVEKGQYRSRGDEPKNPMLRLQVYPPGKEQPITEVAYANLPFVNLASMKNQHCPAEFWYHHPAATAFRVPNSCRRRTENCTVASAPAGSTNRAAKSNRGSGFRFRPIAR